MIQHLGIGLKVIYSKYNLGALSTIDRNYPAWIDSLHFEIGTTHVLHHVFSELPHYNAEVIYFNKIY